MSEIKVVILDGKPTPKLKCPGCGVWGYLDEDQYEGRISTQCEQPGCSFHETRNWKRESESS